LIATGLAEPVAAQAQADYPTKPVRYLIPFAVGGTNDIVGRIVAQRLSDRFRQPVIIDNRGGAGGTLAAEVVARSAADGYTILQGNPGPTTIAANLTRNLAYDPVKDFAPVTLVSVAPLVLVVHPSVSAKNVEELVALARTKPGSFNYATSSQGSINHLGMELFQDAAGIRLLQVPYKGTGAAMTDLLAGQINMTLAGIPPVMEFMNSGRLRALAVSGAKRAELLPQMPSFLELGYRDVEVYTWTGLMLPSRTPTSIISRWHEETLIVLREPAVKERFRSLGVEVVGNAPSEFAAFLKAETAKWARAVKKAGINLN
jgi:tripartite-type tricarboxylate transporter receptor subunit TctC